MGSHVRNKRCSWNFRAARCNPVRLSTLKISFIFQFAQTCPDHHRARYLLNGNILAARAFTTSFVASCNLPVSSTIPIGSAEVQITADSMLNFVQMAVVTCQRAHGEKNKTMREAWVRLCGTYQSRGGALTDPDVRRVCPHSFVLLLTGRHALADCELLRL
jgi:hypothetical protein